MTPEDLASVRSTAEHIRLVVVTANDRRPEDARVLEAVQALKATLDHYDLSAPLS